MRGGFDPPRIKIETCGSHPAGFLYKEWRRGGAFCAAPPDFLRVGKSIAQMVLKAMRAVNSMSEKTKTHCV